MLQSALRELANNAQVVHTWADIAVPVYGSVESVEAWFSIVAVIDEAINFAHNSLDGMIVSPTPVGVQYSWLIVDSIRTII